MPTLNRNGLIRKRKTKLCHFTRRSVIDGLVPNVVSMGAKDAVYLLENAGLQVRLLGRGSVRSQSIAPGTRVRKGEQIVLGNVKNLDHEKSDQPHKRN